MEKILEQLYKGELYPYSKLQTTIEDFKVNRDKAFKSYTVFIEKLSDELKDEFDELIDSQRVCASPNAAIFFEKLLPVRQWDL